MIISLDEGCYRNIMINEQSAFLLAEEASFDSISIEQARNKRNKLYQHYIHTEDITIEGVKRYLLH